MKVEKRNKKNKMKINKIKERTERRQAIEVKTKKKSSIFMSRILEKLIESEIADKSIKKY